MQQQLASPGQPARAALPLTPWLKNAIHKFSLISTKGSNNGQNACQLTWRRYLSNMEKEKEEVYEKCWRFLPLPFHIATTPTHCFWPWITLKFWKGGCTNSPIWVEVCHFIACGWAIKISSFNVTTFCEFSSTFYTLWSLQMFNKGYTNYKWQ